MKLSHWIALFAFESLLTGWIVLGNGAERIGSWTSFFLFGFFGDRWSSDGFRTFVGITWIGALAYFVMGLFNPTLRFGSLLIR